MAPLTDHTQRSTALHDIRLEPIPVKAATFVKTHGLTCSDSNGLAVPASDTAGLTFRGVAHRGYDNSAGADGDISDPLLQDRFCEVDTNGPYSFLVSGTAPKGGEAAYAVDDDTVGLVAAVTNNIKVGRFTEPDPAQANHWFVDIERAQGV